MKTILIICALLFGLALVLVAVGIMLVWNRRIKDQNLSRHALIAALLTTGAAYWLARKSSLAISLQQVELVVFLGLTFVLTYILFWTCIDRVLASFRHSSKFQESSVLSMLYMPSAPGEADFPPTELMRPFSKRTHHKRTKAKDAMPAEPDTGSTSGR